MVGMTWERCFPSTLSSYIVHVVHVCILSDVNDMFTTCIPTACEEVVELYQSKQVAKETSQKPDSRHYYKIKVDLHGNLVSLLVGETERVVVNPLLPNDFI